MLKRASTQMDVWNSLFRDSPAHQLYAFTLDDWQAGKEIHARVFAPGLGIPEDPATGAGAVALVGFLQRFQQCRHGRHGWTVHQGLQIGRPSKLLLDAEFADGAAVSVCGPRHPGGAANAWQGGIGLLKEDWLRAK